MSLNIIYGKDFNILLLGKLWDLWEIDLDQSHIGCV